MGLACGTGTMRGGAIGAVGMGWARGGGAVGIGPIGPIGGMGAMGGAPRNGSGWASTWPLRPATAPPLPQQHGSHSQQGVHCQRENQPAFQQHPETINRLPDRASAAQRTRRIEVPFELDVSRAEHKVLQDRNRRLACSTARRLPAAGRRWPVLPNHAPGRTREQIGKMEKAPSSPEAGRFAKVVTFLRFAAELPTNRKTAFKFLRGGDAQVGEVGFEPFAVSTAPPPLLLQHFVQLALGD